MATLFIRHQVSDFNTWLAAYKSVAPIQKQAGVIAESVYRSDGAPNDVTVTHEFASIDQARAFAESADLRDAMGKAGVVGAPTIWFATKN